jgi:hypothetical protein
MLCPGREADRRCHLNNVTAVQKPPSIYSTADLVDNLDATHCPLRKGLDNRIVTVLHEPETGCHDEITHNGQVDGNNKQSICRDSAVWSH